MTTTTNNNNNNNNLQLLNNGSSSKDYNQTESTFQAHSLREGEKESCLPLLVKY